MTSKFRWISVLVLAATGTCALFALYEALWVWGSHDTTFRPYGVEEALTQSPWTQLFLGHDAVVLALASFITFGAISARKRLYFELLALGFWFLLMAGVWHMVQLEEAFPHGVNMDKAPYPSGVLRLGVELFGGVKALLFWSAVYCGLACGWALEEKLRS